MDDKTVSHSTRLFTNVSYDTMKIYRFWFIKPKKTVKQKTQEITIWKSSFLPSFIEYE